MGSIIGFAYHGIFTISDSTFLVIDDYLKVTLRVAALADLQVSCIWTYDSIGVGEDGPTHLPVETDRGLRVIPQLGRHQAGRCRGDSRGRNFASIDRKTGPHPHPSPGRTSSR